MRLVAAALLLLLLAGTAVAGTCVEACEDDGPDGTCAPSCTDCVCFSHVQSGALLDEVSEGARPSTPAEAGGPLAVCPGCAVDILHVPRVSL